MNIINRKTAHCDKDPFSESDKTIGKSGAGKGDRNRSDTGTFKENYDGIDWGQEALPEKGSSGKVFHKVY